MYTQTVKNQRQREKERILRAAKEKKLIEYKGCSTKTRSLSSKSLEARKK
jgi:hypothetical protein